MADLERKSFRLKKKCTLVSVDDRALALDMEKGVYFNLNEPAFYLSRALKKPRGITFGSLKKKFLSEYGGSAEKAGAEILGFLGLLGKFNLLGPGNLEALGGKEPPRCVDIAVEPDGNLVCIGPTVKPKPPKPPPHKVYFLQLEEGLVAMTVPLVSGEHMQTLAIGPTVKPKPPKPPPHG